MCVCERERERERERESERERERESIYACALAYEKPYVSGYNYE